MITKIISGAQTGADQGGLAAGKALKLKTGGVAPKGFRTETGSNPSLKESYKITEHKSYAYQPRTIENVKHSDGTVWFGNQNSPGGKLTINTCIKLKKPYVINPSKLQLIDWINKKFINVLNVAGNRESTNSGLQHKVEWFLTLVLSSKEYKKENENGRKCV